MNIVITQSMYFPWVGLLEQIALSGIVVHYDDVQFSKGSFVNRVQLKNRSQSTQWLAVPLKDLHLGQLINQVQIDYSVNWQQKHLDLFETLYQDAPFKNDALELMSEVFSEKYCHIGDLSRSSMRSLTKYFGIDDVKRFYDSANLNIGGRNSERVLLIVKHFQADGYITGHGALKYLDHELFEKHHIKVKYMNYQKNPYTQLNGPFNPFVSSLDLVANCGKEGVGCINSTASYWKDFINEPK
jgi:hypothetical protein